MSWAPCEFSGGGYHGYACDVGSSNAGASASGSVLVSTHLARRILLGQRAGGDVRSLHFLVDCAGPKKHSGVTMSKQSGIKTIGLIGSGLIGGTVARLAVAAGYDVVLSNSRGPETLAPLVDELGPHARAATPAAAAAAGDLVVVTVPLRAYRSVPVEPLAGKVVIDTNNYYPDRDGHFAELDGGSHHGE